MGKNARLKYESHTGQSVKIEEIVKKENIDCDFEKSKWLFICPTKRFEQLDKELDACWKLD